MCYPNVTRRHTSIGMGSKETNKNNALQSSDIEPFVVKYAVYVYATIRQTNI